MIFLGGGIRHTVAFVSYGIGLSWASAILCLDNIYCSGIKFHTYGKGKTQQEQIDYWKRKIQDTLNS